MTLEQGKGRWGARASDKAGIRDFAADLPPDKNLVVCMGCGKKFPENKLVEHQAHCPRFQLEVSLRRAQEKLRT